MAHESKLALYGAMGANLAIAVTKFVAAGITGSSAMLSEGIHSMVDTCDSGLLLLGQHLGKRPADRRHPFGHGKEVYFWSLIVAVLIFGIGGGMSVYEGILHLRHPAETTDPTWNYWVLGAAMVFESISFAMGIHQFRSEKPAGLGVRETIRQSKDPTLFTVLLEDAAALIGLLIALLGVGLGQALDSHTPDALASVGIGLLLMGVAAMLIQQSRNLLIGEGAEPDVVDAIEAMAGADPDVESIRDPLTMYFGPDSLLVAMSVRFRRGLGVEDLERAIDRLEAGIRGRVPRVTKIFIEANALTGRGDAVAAAEKT